MTFWGTEEFLSQTGKVTIGVARLLLPYAPGDKLPRMADLAAELKAGNGTIQEAVNYLVKCGALTIETRGAQGSRLLGIDYTLLWQCAGNAWIIGSMPLPYTLRYEGLATGIYAQLEVSQLPFNMTYQRGSLSRGEMVRQGHYHFAVMSELAAEEFVRRYPDVTIVTRLPAQSYVSEHVLISRVPRERIQRIGIDYTSLDEMLLTEEEFRSQQGWEAVPVSRAQVLDLLQEGRFDAVIWNQDGIRGGAADVQLLPLREAEEKRDLASRAALVALRHDPVLNVLKTLFSTEHITLVQQEVLAGQRLPRY